MAKKKAPTRKLPDFARGECFEIATELCGFKDAILSGAMAAQYKEKLEEARRNIDHALRDSKDLRKLGFKKEVDEARKVLKKARRTLAKDPNRKERMDVYYGLHNLYGKVWKQMYTPARIRCGLKKI